VGAYLRAVREYRGRSLADLAAATRVRRVYLSAIEEGKHDPLPSRPFAIGYVRAYAQALDVDSEAAAERFKTEMPDLSEPLRAPVGVGSESPAGRPVILAVVGLLVVAVIGWNVVQRLTASEPAPEPAVPAVPVTADPLQGPIALSAPTPPPAEQTTPAPYVTPGLSGQPAEEQPPAPPAGTIAAPSAVVAPAAFEAKGAIYGAGETGPVVVLQAREPASLIVRGAGGEVYFARQLKAGEAYRAPIGRRLSVEAADPSAFSIYVKGQLRGALLMPQTPLDKVAAEIVTHTPVAQPATPRAAPAQASSAQAASAPPRRPAARPAAETEVQEPAAPAQGQPAPDEPAPAGLF